MNFDIAKLSNMLIIISPANSTAFCLEDRHYQFTDLLLEHLRFTGFYSDVKLEEYLVQKNRLPVYINLYSVAKCNLKCTYCTNQKHNWSGLSLEDCQLFISKIVEAFPLAPKYYVELSCGGEALEDLDKVIEIAKFCNSKSNDIQKEIIPNLLTNGYNLNLDALNKIREARINLTISVDGIESVHNASRKTKDGNGTHKEIMDNLNTFPEGYQPGVKARIHSTKQNLVLLVAYLKETFSSLSIEHINGDGLGVTEENLGSYIKMYSELYNFVQSETIARGNPKSLLFLIRGDSLFSKFFRLHFRRKKTFEYFDGEYSTFTLTPDKNIYTGINGENTPELLIGNLSNDFDHDKFKTILATLETKTVCGKCKIRYICGGRDPVNSLKRCGKFDEVDPVMCKLKMHIYYLTALLSHEVYTHCASFDEILEACLDKNGKYYEDTTLKSVLQELDGRHTYDFLRMIRDHDPIEWNEYYEMLKF